MNDNETINNEGDKITDLLVRGSKNTSIIQEKNLSYIKQKMGSSRPRSKKYIKPTIYISTFS